MTEQVKVEDKEVAKIDQQVVKVEGKEEQVQKEENITLSQAQYDALLGRLDELEDLEEEQKKGQGGKKSPENVDELIEEARKGVSEVGQKLTPEIIDQMKPTQLLRLVHQLNQEALLPVLSKIEELRLQREIDSITSSKEGEDFDLYKQEIYEIASKNPTLTLKQAFKLAKSENPEKATKSKEKTEEREGERKELLRTLPRRRFPSGERSGVSVSASKVSEPETRMDAAQMALDEMRKKGQL